MLRLIIPLVSQSVKLVFVTSLALKNIFFLLWELICNNILIFDLTNKITKLIR